MAKAGKRFSNQKKEEILKHLSHLLDTNTLYHLKADPLSVYFEIRESRRPQKRESEKRKRLKEETKHLSKKKRRLSGTRKRIKPKIRSVKKGRTVNLKGVSY
ncbi:MAG: hypothetical protein GF416_03745 [Candidatus Altiarchaeales archaeon]|nr:hypothetical protein [Candidatus Altiarchaeales archaeon]MBD3416233.1 hypothetical protein [Candidatus Altiarchaeales archaeon]